MECNLLVGIPRSRHLAGGLLLVALLACGTEASAQGKKIEVVPIIPHGATTTSVAFSPDGTRVFSASNDKSVALWDVASGRLIRVYEGHSDGVISIGLSPDGNRLVTGSKDTTLQLWDVESGASIRIMRGHAARLNAVSYAPDGRLIASVSSDKTIKIWSAATGELVRTLEGHTDRIGAVAFSPDSRQLASSSADLTVKLWDVETGELVRTYWGHAGDVGAVTFAPGGKALLSGGDDHTIRMWDTASWAQLRTFRGHSDIIVSVTVSHDGTRIASTSKDKTIKVWDAAGGEATRTLEGHTRTVTEVKFSPDDSRLLSSSVDKSLRLWNAATGALERNFQGPADRVTAVAYANDGRHIFSGGGDALVRMWDGATGTLVKTFPRHSEGAISIDISPDGARIVSASQDKTVMFFDVATGLRVSTIDSHPGNVSSVAFFPDGKRIVTGCVDKIARVFDVASGTLLRAYDGHTSEINSVAVSPDGTRVASGEDDGSVKLWDPATGSTIHTLSGHTKLVSTVRFSPDGARVASASWDGTLKLWNARTGELIRTIAGELAQATPVAFSRDGGKLLSGHSDGSVRLWDAETGTLVRSFGGHRGWVTSVAFAPDGMRFVSGGNDGKLKLWRQEDNLFLAALMASRDGEWIAITPEGFFASSPNAGNMVSVIRGFEIFEIDQAYQALYRPDLVREKLSGDPEGKVGSAAGKRDLEKLLDSGRVPKVRFAPNTKASSASDHVTVAIDVADQGGGIGKIVWRIEGTTYGVTDGSVAGKASREHAFALDPGDNKIEVFAYNKAGLVSSIPATTTIKWTGTQPAAKPRLHILAIGINDYYDSDLRLRFAVPDANSLVEGLKKAGEELYEQVIFTTVLDKDATIQRLDQIFNDLKTSIRPRDVFVFFAAGHGRTEDGVYYFLPQDFKYEVGPPLAAVLSQRAIGKDRLQKWFADIPAKKSVVIFDTCESGSLAGEPQVAFATRGALELLTAIGRLIQATGRTTLTASMDDQPAREGYRGHGVFTFALLDALARGDRNGDKLVQVTELIAHIDGLVPEITEKTWSARQIPRSQFQGSDFTLANQVAALAPAPGEEMIISTAPTHVVSEVVEVLKAKGDATVVVRKLDRFTTVTLIKTEEDWAYIAKDGKAIGYVMADKLHVLQ